MARATEGIRSAERNLEVWAPSAGFRPTNHRATILLAAMTGAYVGAGFVLHWTGTVPGMMSVMGLAGAYAATHLFVLAALPIVLLWRFGAILREAGQCTVVSWQDWPRAWSRCRGEVLNRHRLFEVGVTAITCSVLLAAFGAWKAAIPALSPFWADQSLIALDRVVHGGRQPWEWLQPVLGDPGITTAIDRAYGWWIVLIPIVLTWQCWSTHWALRARFFLTFALAWIVLGSVLAVALSSAGPCFLGELGLPRAEFSGLFGYLHAVHDTHRLYAIETQDFLWRAYSGRLEVPWARISAMPSMHVAMVTLYALVLTRRSKFIGGIAWVYAVIILLGSIHLGWHYALDGYIAAAGLGLIWRASLPLAGAAHGPQDEPLGQPT